jgi:hypothetical protein
MQEPVWVPGLPWDLFPAQLHMAPHWKPFLCVITSRVGRLRGSLSAMDSNMRIASDQVSELATQ